MARHFGAQHMKNGYAGMGGAKGRPIYNIRGVRTVAEGIAAERRKAARMAAANKGKKK